MNYAPKIQDDPPGELTTEQARPEKVADLLMDVLANFRLTDFERELVLQKLNERNLTISTPRAGKTLGAVVDFLKREKERGDEFTLDDVRAVLTRNGVTVSPKEIYNALGYLTRKKHIQNVGHGRYQFGGDENET